jgi:hypothetical protein
MFVKFLQLVRLVRPYLITKFLRLVSLVRPYPLPRPSSVTLDCKMNKIVVYTAIFGDKDELKNITRSAGCDYVVFTDNPKLISDCFKVVVCSPVHADPVRDARSYKICPHKVLPGYEYSLWVDASIEMGEIDIEALFEQYLQSHDIALHAHPARNCIYEEGEVCSKIGKDDPAVIRQQMDWYCSQGYPKSNGLVTNSIIFRRHTPMVSQVNNAWWQELATYSRRDQLSFNYVAWNMGIDYFLIDGYVGNKDVEGFKLHAHKRGDFRNW